MITILLGPWTVFGGFQMGNPFFLWYLFGYIIAAVLVLKQCWAAVSLNQVGDGPISAAHRGAIRIRLPMLFQRVTVPRTATLVCLVVTVVSVTLAVWLHGDSLARYSLVAIWVMSVVGMMLAWLSGI